jgi:hypothetical protein
MSKETPSLWKKVIPRTNHTFLVIAVLLFLGVDTLLVLNDHSLFFFLIVMILVLGAFVEFYRFENLNLTKRFGRNKNGLDGWIYGLIIIRNVVVILNLIPFIQILGFIFIIYGIGFFIPIYAVLIWIRYRKTPKDSPTN